MTPSVLQLLSREGHFALTLAQRFGYMMRHFSLSARQRAHAKTLFLVGAAEVNCSKALRRRGDQLIASLRHRAQVTKSHERSHTRERTIACVVKAAVDVARAAAAL